jgi:hypothetical protein
LAFSVTDGKSGLVTFGDLAVFPFRVTAWIERKRPAFDLNVAEWRTHRSFLELNERAADAETYALAAFELAVAAADEAAEAALEALLARSDAAGAALPADWVQAGERASGQAGRNSDR